MQRAGKDKRTKLIRLWRKGGRKEGGERNGRYRHTKGRRRGSRKRKRKRKRERKKKLCGALKWKIREGSEEER